MLLHLSGVVFISAELSVHEERPAPLQPGGPLEGGGPMVLWLGCPGVWTVSRPAVVVGPVVTWGMFFFSLHQEANIGIQRRSSSPPSRKSFISAAVSWLDPLNSSNTSSWTTAAHLSPLEHQRLFMYTTQLFIFFHLFTVFSALWGALKHLLNTAELLTIWLDLHMTLFYCSHIASNMTATLVRSSATVHMATGQVYSVVFWYNMKWIVIVYCEYTIVWFNVSMLLTRYSWGWELMWMCWIKFDWLTILFCFMRLTVQNIHQPMTMHLIIWSAL